MHFQVISNDICTIPAHVCRSVSKRLDSLAAAALRTGLNYFLSLVVIVYCFAFSAALTNEISQVLIPEVKPDGHDDFVLFVLPLIRTILSLQDRPRSPRSVSLYGDLATSSYQALLEISQVLILEV
ncbi:hypothetical protein GOP47_0027465 [Adiantum capillus-veneris]|nr:hypothetical protein GOP47_0027465 [Adiantum capillus-veneris]